MLIAVSALLILMTALLVVPVAVFTLECLMAARRPAAANREGNVAGDRPRPRIAVVIPAHNEELGIEMTVAALVRELSPADTVLVIADNCSDTTAVCAARGGATVLERNDSGQRGKGYALDFAVRHLRAAPPEVVVFVDADCRLTPGALTLLSDVALATRRPVQARNQMNEPDGVTERSIAGFAWLVRGTVRPTGLAAMGMPCQL